MKPKSSPGADSGRHVVLISPVLRNGGAERVLTDIANGMARHGCRVEIISLAHEADISHLDKNIAIHFLHDAQESAQSGGSLFAKVARRWRLLRRLSGALRQVPPGASVIGFLEPIAQYLWLIRLAGGPGYLVSLHVHETSYFAEFYRSSLRRGFERMLLRMACRAAERVTLPSEGSRKDLIQFFGVPAAKVRMMPNPIDLQEIHRLAERGSDIPPLPIGKTLFVQAARLTKQKNYKLLVEACQRLRTRHEDFVVLCCGEGPERPVLEALIIEAGLAGHIRLLGHLENPYVLMARARAVLLTSKYESFGLVLVEAMVCGAPPISTDCPSGPAELLAGGAGLLVPVDDPQAFADAMLSVIQDDALHDDLRQHARAMSQHYAIDNIVGRWLALLAEP